MDMSAEVKLSSLYAEEARCKKLIDRWSLFAGFWVLFGGPLIGGLLFVLTQGPRITLLLLWFGPAVAAVVAAYVYSTLRTGARDEIRVCEMTRD